LDARISFLIFPACEYIILVRQKQFQIAVRSRGFWLDRSPNSSAYGKRWGGEYQDEDESDVKTYKSLDGIQKKLGRFYRMKGYSMGNEYDMRDMTPLTT
jgi:hypothetical protein